MIIWITGKQGAGKTTLAYALKDAIGNAIVLDGDEIRNIYQQDFSDYGRMTHIVNVGKLAALLERQGFNVICALISPRKHYRQLALSHAREAKLIYVKGGSLWPGTEYDVPDETEQPIIYDWRNGYDDIRQLVGKLFH